MPMPEAGQPPHINQAVTPRRRRSGFRRHRTCLRFLKCCFQSNYPLVRRADTPEAATARFGYSLLAFPHRRRGAGWRTALRGVRSPMQRRGSIRLRAPVGSTWHRYMLPQNIAHTLAAPIKRTCPQKSSVATEPPPAAAPRTRSGRLALRALQRCRPIGTRSPAVRLWRR